MVSIPGWIEEICQGVEYIIRLNYLFAPYASNTIRYDRL